MLIGVIPIFVLDGEAPLLKYGAIEKRINGNKAPTKTHIVRKRLNSFQKQVSIDLMLKCKEKNFKVLSRYKN